MPSSPNPPVADRGGTRSKPPEDPRYTAAVIPTTMLAVLAHIADAEHVAVEPWLAGLGLTRAQIDDAAVRVSFRQASVIIRRAIRAMPRKDIGLQVGTQQSVGTFGLMGLAMMTARTFGEAVAIGVENAAISGALMDVELDAANGHDVALVARPRFPDDEILVFLCEELFSSTLILARTLVGPAFKPARLELTYPAPKYADAYRAPVRLRGAFRREPQSRRRRAALARLAHCRRTIRSARNRP